MKKKLSSIKKIEQGSMSLLIVLLHFFTPSLEIRTLFHLEERKITGNQQWWNV